MLPLLTLPHILFAMTSFLVFMGNTDRLLCDSSQHGQGKHFVAVCCFLYCSGCVYGVCVWVCMWAPLCLHGKSKVLEHWEPVVFFLSLASAWDISWELRRSTNLLGILKTTLSSSSRVISNPYKSLQTLSWPLLPLNKWLLPLLH